MLLLRKVISSGRKLALRITGRDAKDPGGFSSLWSLRKK